MKQEETPTRLGLGIAISLAAYLFFVTASSIVWSLHGAFPTIQALFIQNIVSLICILPLTLGKHFRGFKTKVFPIHLIRDISGVVSYYLYFVAIRYLNLVDATILNYTAPFFVPIMWWMWTKEKVGRNVWWSIVIGFIGVAVILNPSKQIFQLGFLFGLFAGIASGVAFCAIRILNLHLEPTRRTLFYYFTIGSLLTFPFALVYWVPPTPLQWFKGIGIGVATAVGQILLTISYRYGTASYLSPLGYSTVVYAGIISYFLFGKPLGWRSVVGTLLIVAGGTATYLMKKKPHSLSETFQSPNPKEKPPL
jgi:drug/metabolite transporter (DMT)-like permease